MSPAIDMGDLVSTYNPRSRGRLLKNNPGSTLSNIDSYNHSSLAVDFEAAYPQAEQDAPGFSARHDARLAAASAAPSFQGLDAATRQRSRKSNIVSFLIHAAIISGVLWLTLGSHSPIRHAEVTVVEPVPITLYAPPPPPKIMPVAKVTGGGGGGAHQIVEPTKSTPARVIPQMQLNAPRLLRFSQPKLAAEPSEVVKIAENSSVPNLGMSNSPQIALASQGKGGGSGFGAGLGGGIGAGGGPGSGGGLMNVGGGVSAPQIIHSIQPEFTQEAREANLQGNVAIQLIVDAQGNPQNIRITRHLGMGLDEKAIEAARQYKFRPAIYQGHPVAVQIVIDVDFHLH